MKDGQVFSTYRYVDGRYDYWSAPIGSVNDVPASGFMRKAKSNVAEGLAATLPANAVPIGQGDEAQGIVAVPRASTGSWVFALLGVGVAAGGAWWWWRRRRAA